MKNNAFVIVEVLVAFVILTTTMTLLTYAQKNFNSNIKRVHNYEKVYVTLLSLKNKIDIEMQLGEKEHYEGKLNDINYRIDMKKIKEGNDLNYNNMNNNYTKGIHFFMLYEIKVHLYEIEKTYSFYKLRTYFDKTLIEQQKKGL